MSPKPIQSQQTIHPSDELETLNPSQGQNRSHYGSFSLDSSRSRHAFVNHVQVGDQTLLTRPWFGPLMFDIEASEARDICANERTCLSYLRLSIYLAVVSVAIVLTFHLASEPTSLERRIAKPLGIVFWLLSLASLSVGLASYLKTLQKYKRKVALVQSGVGTQILGVVTAFVIIVTCVLFITVNVKKG